MILEQRKVSALFTNNTWSLLSKIGMGKLLWQAIRHSAGKHTRFQACSLQSIRGIEDNE